MNITQIIPLIRDVVAVLVITWGAIAAIFVYFRLTPVLRLRITPSWTDDSREILLIRMEIENISYVRLYNPQARLSIVEQPIPPPGGSISEWVPFQPGSIQKCEEPLTPVKPIQILTTTKAIFPREVITLERIYRPSNSSVVVHIGLQIEANLGLFGRVVTLMRQPYRQTSTALAVGLLVADTAP